MNDEDDILLRRPEVEKMTRLSRSEIYRRMKARRFPRPVSVGPMTVAWRRSEIMAWLASLRERRPEDWGASDVSAR